MSDTVIRVENVSKLYRLGEVGTGSLAHDVNRWWHRVRGKEDPYLMIGEVNDRTKPVAGAQKRNLTTEDTTERLGRGKEEQTKFGPKGEGAGATESKSTEGTAGLRLAGQAGAEFPNPSTSELARDSENTSLIRSANAPRSSEEQSDSKALHSADVSAPALDSAPSSSPRPLDSGLSTPSSALATRPSTPLTINGSVLGVAKKEGCRRQAQRASRVGRATNQIDAKIDEIIDFSKIWEFIDMPVQSYFSGMSVRLGFAVAAALEPSFEIVKNRPHSRLFQL